MKTLKTLEKIVTPLILASSLLIPNKASAEDITEKVIPNDSSTTEYVMDGRNIKDPALFNTNAISVLPNWEKNTKNGFTQRYGTSGLLGGRLDENNSLRVMYGLNQGQTKGKKNSTTDQFGTKTNEKNNNNYLDFGLFSWHDLRRQERHANGFAWFSGLSYTKFDQNITLARPGLPNIEITQDENVLKGAAGFYNFHKGNDFSLSIAAGTGNGNLTITSNQTDSFKTRVLEARAGERSPNLGLGLIIDTNIGWQNRTTSGMTTRNVKTNTIDYNLGLTKSWLINDPKNSINTSISFMGRNTSGDTTQQLNELLFKIGYLKDFGNGWSLFTEGYTGFGKQKGFGITKAPDGNYRKTGFSLGIGKSF